MYSFPQQQQEKQEEQQEQQQEQEVDGNNHFLQHIYTQALSGLNQGDLTCQINQINPIQQQLTLDYNSIANCYNQYFTDPSNNNFIYQLNSSLSSVPLIPPQQPLDEFQFQNQQQSQQSPEYIIYKDLIQPNFKQKLNGSGLDLTEDEVQLMIIQEQKQFLKNMLEGQSQQSPPQNSPPNNNNTSTSSTTTPTQSKTNSSPDMSLSITQLLQQQQNNLQPTATANNIEESSSSSPAQDLATPPISHCETKEGKRKKDGGVQSASRDYRQRKKDHIADVEKQLKDLQLENQRLKQENQEMQKVTLTDLMKPDRFHQVSLDFQKLLVRLAESVINNIDDTRAFEQLMQFFLFSMKLRSTVVERDIEKIINPILQLKLVFMGYRSLADSVVVCGTPMASSIWWPNFIEQIGLSESQRKSIEELWSYYVRINDELKEERQMLDDQIKQLSPFPKKILNFDSSLFSTDTIQNITSKHVNSENTSSYNNSQQQTQQTQTPAIDLQLQDPKSLLHNISKSSPISQLIQSPYGRPQRIQSEVRSNTKEPLVIFERSSLTVLEVLEMVEKLEKMKMNFIKHRRNICEIDIALTRILTPIQNAKLILQLHARPYMNIELVEQINRVWGALHVTSETRDNPIKNQLMPGTSKFNFFDFVGASTAQEEVKIDTLKTVYENLYKSMAKLSPPSKKE